MTKNNRKTQSKDGKKKLLYFVPVFPNLTETFIEREVSKLVEFGNIDVKVFSLKEGSGKVSENLKEKIKYKRLDPISFLLGLTYFITRWGKVIGAFKIVMGDRSRFFDKRIYLFLKALGYSRLFDRERPDHIHAHFLSDPSTIALVASKILGVPFSVSAHAADVFVYGTLISVKAREGKFISVCNQHAWREVVEQANKTKSGGKVRLIFHGVDEKDIFSEEPRYFKSDKPLIFLGGTRLVEKKGIKYVIEASKILKDRGVDHQIDIVGPGPLYNDFTKQIKELGVESHVNIHGGGKGTPFKEVAQFYRIADIFLLPNIETDEGDIDGIPNVIIEAALAKLPIVTTGAGSVTDVIDESTGILIPQKDSMAIANVVEKLIFDKEMREYFGQQAYKRAKQMFDINKNVGELEKLILE